MNRDFEIKAEQLGFAKENQIYELEKDNVCYQLPNQKLPFLKKDFYVKNSYADFMIGGTEIGISIYDGNGFQIQLNHYRSINGKIDKDENFLIEKNSLNSTEKIFYEENQETIEQVARKNYRNLVVLTYFYRFIV